MMKFVIASHNKNKITELRILLKKITTDDSIILSLDDIGFFKKAEETGNTFEQNAAIKAKAVSSLGYIAIADDSGLEVDALQGAPGIHSARYSKGSDFDNNEKLLKELAGIPVEKRTARFVCVIVCAFPCYKDHLAVYGSCEGIILESARGKGGFGYDPLFFYKPLKKSFAELSIEEKNTISHRGAAMRALEIALPPALKKYAT